MTSRDSCRLMLFAFAGETQAVESLLRNSLNRLPGGVADFWRATALQFSGDVESARRELERLLPSADPLMRVAIERRLSRILLEPAGTGVAALAVVESARLEQAHERNFASRRSLFSKQARVTQLVIAVNVLMFGLEFACGGATNLETLLRLGALYPPAVRAGEWWRVPASIFLHFGIVHLLMNMIALWVLGPFMEFALGARRYLFVYLAAGMASMLVVMLFSPNGGITVGASGCIMGLVGAMGAVMLRGWVREKALAAKRRLIAVVLIVIMQTAFDLLVPQVSMTAHLSGAVIGFILAALLRDRFSTAA